MELWTKKRNVLYLKGVPFEPCSDVEGQGEREGHRYTDPRSVTIYSPFPHPHVVEISLTYVGRRDGRRKDRCHTFHQDYRPCACGRTWVFTFGAQLQPLRCSVFLGPRDAYHLDGTSESALTTLPVYMRREQVRKQ